MIDPSEDPPASKVKLFILVVLLIGAIVGVSYFMILRSRHTDPPPKVPLSNSTLQLVPLRGRNASAVNS